MAVGLLELFASSRLGLGSIAALPELKCASICTAGHGGKHLLWKLVRRKATQGHLPAQRGGATSFRPAEV